MRKFIETKSLSYLQNQVESIQERGAKLNFSCVIYIEEPYRLHEYIKTRAKTW